MADITIPSTMPLANRSYNFTAALLDMAGNEGERSAAAYTTVVDTVGPVAPTGLDLLARDDSGVSNTDNITNKTTGLTLTGNLPADAVILNIYDTSTDPSVRELFDNSTFLSTSATALGVYPPDVRNVSLMAATLNGLGISGSVLANVVTAKTGSADRWLMGVYNSELDQTQMVEVWLSLDANGQLHASTAGAERRQQYRLGQHHFEPLASGQWHGDRHAAPDLTRRSQQCPRLQLWHQSACGSPLWQRLRQQCRFGIQLVRRAEHRAGHCGA